MLLAVEEAPWIRAKADGFLGLWHMRAGDSKVGVLAACDRTFPNDTQIEERAVGLIPANERCPVCQGVQVAAERSPIVTPDDTG
jgi:cytochrome c-type biogenesis protein CcmH/NrfF